MKELPKYCKGCEYMEVRDGVEFCKDTNGVKKCPASGGSK